MKIHEFDWDEINESHIARHGIKPEQAEEIFSGNFFIRKSRSGRYVAFGQDVGGHYLFVVFERLPDYRIRVITARPMDSKEKSFYRRIKR